MILSPFTLGADLQSNSIHGPAKEKAPPCGDA